VPWRPVQRIYLYEWLESTTFDITEEQANWQPAVVETAPSCTLEPLLAPLFDDYVHADDRGNGKNAAGEDSGQQQGTIAFVRWRRWREVRGRPTEGPTRCGLIALRVAWSWTVGCAERRLI
jgi:hypothetical protein